MRFISSLSTGALSVLVVLSLVPIASAQMGTAVSGTMTFTYARMDTMMVSEADMHMMNMGMSEGTNKCTSENIFMDGAAVSNWSMSDMTQGNGPHDGCAKLEKGDDSAVAKWSGNVTTTMSAEGTPTTTFEGTFTYVGGTGKYKGIQGGGTYKGTFTGKDTYTSDWQGTYTIGE